MRRLLSYMRNGEFRAAWDYFNSKEASPLIQFGKYGIAGVMAVAVYVGCYKLLSIPFPVTDSMTAGQKIWYYTVKDIPAFLISNTVAYILNVKWVFTGGRHSQKKEVFLFYAVSALSFGAGWAIGAMLIGPVGLPEWAAVGSKIIASVLINYVARKFFIFKG